jgi:hypothetical protein
MITGRWIAILDIIRGIHFLRDGPRHVCLVAVIAYKRQKTPESAPLVDEIVVAISVAASGRFLHRWSRRVALI